MNDQQTDKKFTETKYRCISCRHWEMNNGGASKLVGRCELSQLYREANYVCRQHPDYAKPLATMMTIPVTPGRGRKPKPPEPSGIYCDGCGKDDAIYDVKLLDDDGFRDEEVCAACLENYEKTESFSSVQHFTLISERKTPDGCEKQNPKV